MAEISVKLERSSRRRLEKMLRDVPGGLARQVPIAINRTATFTRSVIAKSVTKEVSIKQKDFKKHIKIKRKATKSSPSAHVQMSGKAKARISLKLFGAKQTKKGVGYKIDKSKGRQRVEGAFMGPKPGAVAIKLGGHVFHRLPDEGRKFGRRLLGPSPVAVFDRSGAKKPTQKEVSKRFAFEMKRRVRDVLFKARNK